MTILKPALLSLTIGIALTALACWWYAGEVIDNEQPATVVICQGSHVTSCGRTTEPVLSPLAAATLQKAVGTVTKISYLPPISYRLPGASY